MNQRRFITALLIVIGVISIVAMTQITLPKSQMKLVVVGVAIANTVLWWVAHRYFESKRRAAITAALTARGLRLVGPAETPFVHDLRRGQRSLHARFGAIGHDANGELALAEFTYLTGSGKHTRTHRNMQVFRPAPGHNWPALHLTRRPSFLERSIKDFVNPADIGLGNEAFAKRWSLICDDRDFALLLLSPIIQDWLMLSDKDESWTIARGHVCFTREHKCKPDDIDPMIHRLDEFLALIPSELAAYETPSGSVSSQRDG